MLEFIREFVKDPGSIGSVVPSSSCLAELITSVAPLEKATCIAEFGCGTGVLTERIVEKKREGSLLLSFDINERFVNITRSKCPTAVVVHDSVLNLREHMNKHGVEEFDVIISSLPWGQFNRDYQVRLLNIISSVLKENGEFLTFSYVYSPLFPNGRRFSSMVRDYFSSVNIAGVAWRNFPPAFVYRCLS